MKAILEFDLPDDNEEHVYAVNATKTMIALHDIDNQLRTWLKHGGYKFTTIDDALQAVRDMLHEDIEL
jgi:hypothetical protein